MLSQQQQQQQQQQLSQHQKKGQVGQCFSGGCITEQAAVPIVMTWQQRQQQQVDLELGQNAIPAPDTPPGGAIACTFRGGGVQDTPML
jgi:hypothetical protein